MIKHPKCITLSNPILAFTQFFPAKSMTKEMIIGFFGLNWVEWLRWGQVQSSINQSGGYLVTTLTVVQSCPVHKSMRSSFCNKTLIPHYLESLCVKYGWWNGYDMRLVAWGAKESRALIELKWSFRIFRIQCKESNKTYFMCLLFESQTVLMHWESFATPMNVTVWVFTNASKHYSPLLTVRWVELYNCYLSILLKYKTKSKKKDEKEKKKKKYNVKRTKTINWTRWLRYPTNICSYE